MQSLRLEPSLGCTSLSSALQEEHVCKPCPPGALEPGSPTRQSHNLRSDR